MFKKMAVVINSTKNKVTNPTEGFLRVENDNLAFLWDVAVIGKIKKIIENT